MLNDVGSRVGRDGVAQMVVEWDVNDVLLNKAVGSSNSASQPYAPVTFV